MFFPTALSRATLCFHARLAPQALTRTLHWIFQVRCTDVEFESARTETFLDIQLKVKGIPDLISSFKDYVSVEKLDGENKYAAEGHGLQDAKKGIIFQSFPPVLNLQLRRFEYDMMRDESYKVTDRFEFPQKINLDEFLDEREATPANYTLHSVLVQGGDTGGGHYIVYVRPSADGAWFKFDDDNVIETTEAHAVEGTFGANPDETGRVVSCSSAYMLVYIRDDRIEEITRPVPDPEVPAHLGERFAQEDIEAKRKQEELEEQMNYVTVAVQTESDVRGIQALELLDVLTQARNNEPNPHYFRVHKKSTLNDLYEQIAQAEDLKTMDPARMQLFPFEARENSTTRPGSPIALYTGPQQAADNVITAMASRPVKVNRHSYFRCAGFWRPRLRAARLTR